MATQILAPFTIQNIRDINMSSIRSLWRTSQLLLFLSIFTFSSGYLQFNEITDPNNPDIVLKNMVIENTTGNIFVGSVNNLYKLTSDLSEIVVMNTGPRLDSLECRPPPNVCAIAKTDTNSINKLLLIHQGELLTCSNLYQGSCQKRNIDTLDVDESFSREVVSNYEHGNTIGFIAPSHLGDALYTASPFGGWKRSAIPTIARRHIQQDPSEDLFDPISEIIIPVNTLEEANNNAQYAFNISYVYGFSSGNHVYFVALQVEKYKIKDSPQRTKIVRVCQDDNNPQFHSYVELPLLCMSLNGSITYNLAQSAFLAKTGSDLGDIKAGEDVLFVTFAKSVDGSSLEPEDKSAVCMYSVRTIDAMIAQRRIECADNPPAGSNTEIEWLGNTPCFLNLDVVDDVKADPSGYCFTHDFNQPLGSSTISVQASAIYTTDDSLITAIAATPHLAETVIFLGDQQGNLRKLRVMSKTKASVYQDITIDGSSRVAQNGLHYDTNKDFIYVMTERRITKVPVEECELYSNCEDCTQVGAGVGDPYCGWCSLQKRCTRRTEAECAGSDDLDSRRWLGPAGMCSQVEAVIPANTPRDRYTEIELVISNLPRLDDGTSHTYECVFGEFATTMATVKFMTDQTNITCGTPNADSIPRSEEGSLSVELYIRASETNQKIARTMFDFYECSAFVGCLKCVDNTYACDWCIYKNTCTGNADNCGGVGVIGSLSSTNAERTNKGPQFCPYIRKNQEEILLPVDVSTGIDILAANLPDPQYDGNFECIILLDKKEAKVSATRVNETLISCTAWNYMYSADVATMEVALNVQWNGSFILDNPDKLTVTLYKCNTGRGNCGSCLMADRKFKCGWCSEPSNCVHESKCRFGSNSKFLFGDDVCPNPRITGFEPKAGHIAGGTEVRIHGINLGQVASDIISIKVAKQPCLHLNNSYEPSEIVVCRTSPIPMPMKGLIEVSVGTGGRTYVGLSDEFFSYVQPTISLFSPIIGPESGGTEIVIEGTHLDAGSSVHVKVAGENCTLTQKGSKNLTCLTDPATPGNRGPITIVFEEDGIEVSTETFSYEDDPIIVSMDRFRTIISGGLQILVKGTNLNVIQSPKMIFHLQGQQFVTDCYDITPTHMMCVTPDLRPFNLSAPFPFKISKSMIGFTLDGVTAFRTLTNAGDVREQFEVHQDPVYHKFAGPDGNIVEFEYGQRKYLEISGENLTLASDDMDVHVSVGLSSCEPQLTSKGLTCDLPDKEPESLPGDTMPRVIVRHGNLEFDIGFVRYLPEGLPLPLIIGIAVGVFILILIFILIVACYRHIGERERRIKRLEKQRDEMEMRVAQECKDAFTELQISVLTVSGDVEGSGIPFRSYRGYTSMVLFPDNPDHPALKEIPVAKEKISGIKKEVLQRGLAEFGSLIGNKSFLRVFVHTLERQKMLTTKDKTNIASLLMIALHNKLEYLTVVMKSLMQDMIARYVREGCPHVLMRRSDTVVEKVVSHWVAILLYDFMRETAGQPLFHLYYAIKQQVAKGPVDAITGEARYGLSELKVIRQQTDYKAMTISAVGLDREAGPVSVKVLDCDTISQCKEKILDALYKTMPYSQRPQKEELDLEWKDNTFSQILLDDDGSRVMEGEWKRLNTLAHYKVPDGATLVLVRGQGMSMTPHGSLQRGSPTKRVGALYTPHSPASSVTPILDMENGIGVMKNWHLVKKANHDSLRKGDKYHTLMAEIYLPRLLTTKGILQQFVDELFDTLFTLDSDSSSVPMAIKYLFDFLDEEAAKHNLNDSNITHFWKSNILQLRFWVNMVNNPDMLFDINRSDTVLACMSVIGQTMMDSCSVTQHQLTPDSPSSKLLYAKDIQQYKEIVSTFYRDIHEYPAISDQDMNATLANHSQRHNFESNFQAINALNELYFCYACIYRSQLMEALDDDESTRKLLMGDKLDKIFKLMADSV